MLVSTILKSLFRRSRLAKPFSPPEHHRSKYMQIRDNLLKSNYKNANTMINQLDDEIDRQVPHQYIRYLQNKIVIQFQLRKYGHCSLAAKNSLMFYQAANEQSPYFMSSITLLQLLSVQFFYNRQKQYQTTNLLWYRMKISSSMLLKIKICYFNAMSCINQGKIDEGIKHLLEVINNQQYNAANFNQQDVIVEIVSEIAFISLITVRILFIETSKASEQDQEAMAIRLVKGYINSKTINQQQLKMSNPFVVYDQYNEYSDLFPQQTEHYKNNVFKLDALIGQKLLQLKNYNGLYLQLQKVVGSIFEPWLKAQKFLEQGQMEEAIKEFEKAAQHEDVSPEYDILKYESIKYVGQILNSQKQESGDQRLEEAESFRLNLRIERGTEHLPYLIVPYEDILGIKELDV